jgi:UDP-N-acetylmuramate--alanine ligase
VRGLLPSIRKPVITYGIAPDADLRAEKIVIDGFSTRFEVVRKGQPLGTVTIPTPGVHVALNSLAAIAIALELGITFDIAAQALAKFSGISRRFEIKGEAGGRIVIDDYAHHPEEVKATLAAARAAFKRRIVAVFQPHRYTRMRDLFEGFLRAFDDADMLCLMDIYPAGEDAIPGVSSHRLYEAILKRGHLNVRYLGALGGAAQKLAELTVPGDVVLTLGAGDIYALGDQLLAELGVERKTHAQA